VGGSNIYYWKHTNNESLFILDKIISSKHVYFILGRLDWFFWVKNKFFNLYLIPTCLFKGYPDHYLSILIAYITAHYTGFKHFFP